MATMGKSSILDFVVKLQDKNILTLITLDIKFAINMVYVVLTLSLPNWLSPNKFSDTLFKKKKKLET